MKSELPLLKNFSTQEQQKLILPTFIGSFAFIVAIIVVAIFHIQESPRESIGLIIISAAGIVYLLCLFFYILPRPILLEKLRWGIAIVNSLGLWVLAFFTLPTINAIYYYLALITVVTLAIIGGRALAYFYALSASFASLIVIIKSGTTMPPSLALIGFVTSAIIITEATLRLIDTLHKRIERLETVNKFARNVSVSIEMEQVVILLNAAIQNTMQADTFFVGMLDNEGMLVIDMLYDDGEYYPNLRLSLEGTLSGWVIRNNKPLFLPDLRVEPMLDGVELKIIGTEKTNLSWMGVPLKTAHFTGIIVLGSYADNAFNRMDMELLENLAQHAAFALDNAYHHSQVEEQSRLDSMTGVFNHGYFLKRVLDFTKDSLTTKAPFSVIMLDVDHFKRYNDTYGHQFGDLVLQKLVETIRTHIKSTDVVGRWGGEEFAVALPNANGQQALMVARRIQRTMAEMHLMHPEKGEVPAPTVSQGIAIFPLESNDVFNLIGIADRRLYIAKERGRNQIEPDERYWEKTIPRQLPT